MARFLNAYIGMMSSASRSRMAANGHQIEICPNKIVDGTFYGYGRTDQNLVNNFAYGSDASGRTALVGGTAAIQSASPWFNAVAHEYFWNEDFIFFPPSQREPSHASYNQISLWPEVATFQTACNANGQAQTGGSLCNGMRTAQRGQSIAYPTSTIQWNATGAQVLAAVQNIPCVIPNQVQISGSSGPLPGTPVDLVFFGQYNQLPIPAFSTITNSLAGGGTPVSSITRAGAAGADPILRIGTTGTVTGGSFIMGFTNVADLMLTFVGTGTSGTTPAQRVTQWTNMTSTFNWFL